MKVQTFNSKISGPFELLYQNQFFNGWPVLDDRQSIAMAFPVEDWRSSAAVVVKQVAKNEVEITVHSQENAERASDQALAALSLDEDAKDWPAVGERDGTLKELQLKYHYMRPTLFHSPYEAAAHFIIGHRISMVQGRKIRESMAKELGEKFSIDGHDCYAFPTPRKLLEISDFMGLNATKIDRLHAVADAALDGWLTRSELRKLGEEEALAKLETLPGVGPFFSQGILNRGVGSTDRFTHDDLTYHAIGLRYGLGKDPSREAVLKVAEHWRPYRMWAVVLHHVWLRESGNMPTRTFSKK